MVRRRLLLVFCFGAWIACADGTGPPGDPGEPPRTPERMQLHELRWKPTEQPRAFEAKGDVDLANIVQSAGAGGQKHAGSCHQREQSEQFQSHGLSASVGSRNHQCLPGMQRDVVGDDVHAVE